MAKNSKKIIPVVIGIIKKRNKYLLTKRVHDDKRFHDKWQFPGGEIEFGESITDALNRELREELDIEVKILKFVGKVYEPMRHDWHGLMIPYLCRMSKIDAKITLDADASEYRWLTLPEIMKLNALEHTKEMAQLVSKL